MTSPYDSPRTTHGPYCEIHNMGTRTFLQTGTDENGRSTGCWVTRPCARCRKEDTEECESPAPEAQR